MKLCDLSTWLEGRLFTNFLNQNLMKTLITPAAALRLAFDAGCCMPPETLTEADIVAAEWRYVVPVIGPALHEKLLSGEYAAFRNDYLAVCVALFTRVVVQPRLDIRTGQRGTVAPKSADMQPAGEAALCRLQHRLREQARTLLRRAASYLAAHADEFPEYDACVDQFNRCSTDGGFVQTF